MREEEWSVGVMEEWDDGNDERKAAFGSSERFSTNIPILQYSSILLFQYSITPVLQ